MIISSPLHSVAASYAAAQPGSNNSAVGEQYLSSNEYSSKVTLVKPINQLDSSARKENSIASEEQASSPDPSAKSGESAEEQSQSTEQKESQEKAQLLQDQQEIKMLSARDREVRTHEQAHMAVGGQYAGAASYQYERGPDGVNYAVAGEVPIDVGRGATPEESIRKAQIVRRAALAPADPSPQDRSVAAMASQMEADARQELNAQRTQEAAREEEVTADESAEPGLASQTKSSAISGDDSGISSSQSSNSFSGGVDGTISSRLAQGIQNASLLSNHPGQILNQIA